MIDSSCSTTGTTTSNMNVIRYGVIPEFIYIVGRPYGGIPEFIYISWVVRMVAFQSSYISWVVQYGNIPECVDIMGRTIWWHSIVRIYRGSYGGILE